MYLFFSAFGDACRNAQIVTSVRKPGPRQRLFLPLLGWKSGEPPHDDTRSDVLVAVAIVQRFGGPSTRAVTMPSIVSDALWELSRWLLTMIENAKRSPFRVVR